MKAPASNGSSVDAAPHSGSSCSPSRRNSMDGSSTSNMTSTAVAAASPLHVTSGGHIDNDDDKLEKAIITTKQKTTPKITGKQIVSFLLVCLLLALLWDATMVPPEQRFLKPDASDIFLTWVSKHPYRGLGAFLVVIATCVVLMIPIGTPLTLGCGYVYKGAYGWILGITVATIVSMLGSALGAVTCFVLGRYLMRDRVQKWSRNYPLFDAINIAVSEHGFRIMAMLYLTPVLPLGPVSYMCGTTSMPLSSFAFAKVASTPLMLLYVFIGASTGTLIVPENTKSNKQDSTNNNNIMVAAEAKQLEQNKTMIIFGIVLSSIMIGFISHSIKKELYKIFERQKQEQKNLDVNGEANNDGTKLGGAAAADDSTIELGHTTAPRQRRHASTSIDS